MKLLSWNVNGIRAAIRKGFAQSISELDPDIICLQETKAQPEQVDFSMDGYQAYWNSAVRKGYSGTLIYAKVKPISVQRGMGIAKHDDEGRVLTAEFEDYTLVNCYTPNAKRDLSRLDYRTQEWDIDFAHYLKSLETSKPVIFCGDLNVAHQDIDLANPKANKRNAGFTAEERASFDRLIQLGFVDTFREFEKGPGHYTWWSQRPGIRERNIGWRIDYFCVSRGLHPRIKAAGIYPQILGSDHCPVYLELF